jgi:hypothetical protein
MESLGRKQEELYPEHRRRAQLTLALCGIMLPPPALATVEGIAVESGPRAIASLNGMRHSMSIYRCRANAPIRPPATALIRRNNAT